MLKINKDAIRGATAGSAAKLIRMKRASATKFSPRKKDEDDDEDLDDDMATMIPSERASVLEQKEYMRSKSTASMLTKKSSAMSIKYDITKGWVPKL